MLSLPEGDTHADHDADADYVNGDDYATMILFCIVEMMVKVPSPLSHIVFRKKSFSFFIRVTLMFCEEVYARSALISTKR